MRYSGTTLRDAVENLLKHPPKPGFGNFADKTVMDTANAIISSEDKIFCAATDDRRVLLGALLGCLADKSDLILPHDLSVNVLDDACSQTGCKTLVVSEQLRIASEYHSIIPKSDGLQNIPDNFDIDPDNPFLHLFTGGSTGHPRIWTKTPLNLLGEAIYIRNLFGISQSDKILAAVSPRHIYGLLFSLLLPWVSGAGVILGTPYFPAEIGSIMRDEAITIFIGSPLQYKSLNTEHLNNTTLKMAFSSAGPLDRDDARRFITTSGAELIEIYGSTETGGIATRSRKHGETNLTPFPIIDSQITGETLLISSPFVSPELPKVSNRYIESSDRVCKAGKGFTLLGRFDSVVKIGGKRIDLAEIEEIIKKLPGIEDACVTALPAKPGREHELAALLVADTDRKAIVNSLEKRLDPIRIPRRIRFVEKLPYSGNGKRNQSEVLRLLDGNSRGYDKEITDA